MNSIDPIRNRILSLAINQINRFNITETSNDSNQADRFKLLAKLKNEITFISKIVS